MGITTRSVSYTHLDVYKRQIFEEYEKVLEERAEEAAVKQAVLQEEVVFEEENAATEEVFENAAIV